jgi:chromosome segregation ATPase
MKKTLMNGGMIAALVAAGGVWLHARQTAPASNDQVLQALLVEVRGLRAAMEQMASAGPRVQLFASRLQLQEARINTMIRRLENVRDSLTSAQQEVGNSVDRQRHLEEQLATPGDHPNRQEIADMLTGLKRERTDLQAKVTRLTAEEAQLTQDLSVEQARWTDINSRLDELEKTLSSKR